MSATRVDEIEAATATAAGAGELGSLLRAPSSRKAFEPAAASLGRIVSVGAEGVAHVEFPGSGGAVPARLAVAASRDDLRRAMASNQSVVLVFENGDAALPIVTGLIQPLQPETGSDQPQTVEADVDGKRVRIVAQDEIVLQCGNASITLRRNGRVVIRGTYVETSSEGTNRVKGGQVRIN